MLRLYALITFTTGKLLDLKCVSYGRNQSVT